MKYTINATGEEVDAFEWEGPTGTHAMPDGRGPLYIERGDMYYYKPSASKWVRFPSTEFDSLHSSALVATVPGSLGAAVDNSTALQNFLSALPATDVTVIFPAGAVYGLAAGVSLSGKTRWRINFNGARFVQTAEISQLVGSFRVAFKFATFAQSSFADGAYDGNSLGAGFIGLESCTDCIVEGNEAFAVGNASFGNAAFASISGTRNRWTKNTARNAGSGSAVRGFWLGGSNTGQSETGLIVSNNVAHDMTATGIVLQSAGALAVGNHCFNNSGSGIISPSSQNALSTDHTIFGNVCHGNTFYGYQSDVTGAYTLERVTISGNVFYANASGGILLSKVNDFSACGNSVFGSSSSVLFPIQASSRGTISGNTFKHDGSGAMLNFGGTSIVDSDISITGNNFYGGTGRCINLEASNSDSALRRFTISGNTITNGSHGIYVRPSHASAVVADISIVGNVATGQSTAGFFSLAVSNGQTTGFRMIGNSGTKSISSTVFAAEYGNTWNDVYSAGNTSTSATPNYQNGEIQNWTQNGNVTVNAPTNPPATGKTLTLIFTQDATGSRTIAWNSTYRNAPAWSAGAANTKASATFMYDGTNWQFVGGSSAYA